MSELVRVGCLRGMRTAARIDASFGESVNSLPRIGCCLAETTIKSEEYRKAEVSLLQGVSQIDSCPVPMLEVHAPAMLDNFERRSLNIQ
jgi:hypothetical protein